MADPYQTLGIARTATEAEIKSAYRTLAKELHPDRNTDNPEASERFSKVTQAYDLLSDKDTRAQFDRGEIDGDGNPANPFGGAGGFGSGGGFGGGGSGFRGARGQAGPGGFGGQQGFGQEGDLGDIFEGLFGGGAARGPAGFGGQRPPPPPRKGADIGYRLRVPFTDAATRADQRITLSDGKTIDLKLPAGLETGDKVRLKGKGERGPGGAGDGIVTLSIDHHAHFRRDGDDVRLDLPLTLGEALEGARVKCPTVDGAVMLTIKPGTNGGTVMRLKGKGFSSKGGGRGDQLVTLEIQLPDDADALAELAKRLDGWQDTRNVREGLNV